MKAKKQDTTPISYSQHTSGSVEGQEDILHLINSGQLDDAFELLKIEVNMAQGRDDLLDNDQALEACAALKEAGGSHFERLIDYVKDEKVCPASTLRYAVTRAGKALDARQKIEADKAAKAEKIKLIDRSVESFEEMGGDTRYRYLMEDVKACIMGKSSIYSFYEPSNLDLMITLRNDYPGHWERLRKLTKETGHSITTIEQHMMKRLFKKKTAGEEISAEDMIRIAGVESRAGITDSGEQNFAVMECSFLSLDGDKPHLRKLDFAKAVMNTFEFVRSRTGRNKGELYFRDAWSPDKVLPFRDMKAFNDNIEARMLELLHSVDINAPLGMDKTIRAMVSRAEDDGSINLAPIILNDHYDAKTCTAYRSLGMQQVSPDREELTILSLAPGGWSTFLATDNDRLPDGAQWAMSPMDKTRVAVESDRINTDGWISKFMPYISCREDDKVSAVAVMVCALLGNNFVIYQAGNSNTGKTTNFSVMMDIVFPWAEHGMFLPNVSNPNPRLPMTRTISDKIARQLASSPFLYLNNVSSLRGSQQDYLCDLYDGMCAPEKVLYAGRSILHVIKPVIGISSTREPVTREDLLSRCVRLRYDRVVDGFDAVAMSRSYEIDKPIMRQGLWELGCRVLERIIGGVDVDPRNIFAQDSRRKMLEISKEEVVMQMKTEGANVKEAHTLSLESHIGQAADKAQTDPFIMGVLAYLQEKPFPRMGRLSGDWYEDYALWCKQHWGQDFRVAICGELVKHRLTHGDGKKQTLPGNAVAFGRKVGLSVNTFNGVGWDIQRVEDKDRYKRYFITALERGNGEEIELI